MLNSGDDNVTPLRGHRIGHSVAVIGLGATGSHVVRQLLASDPAHRPARIVLSDRRQERVEAAAQTIHAANASYRNGPGNRDRDRVGRRYDSAPDTPIVVDRVRADEPANIVRTCHLAILATDCGSHVSLATEALKAGCHTVSMSDRPDEVDGLLRLDALAQQHQRSLVVGAGMAPGLSCLLARYAGDQLDSVHAINVAKAGTAGPACAYQHHRALKSSGRDWVGHRWEYRRGGSGRDLAWFPDPIGPRDCYRGALPSPILLQRQYPEADRISARVSATRRDRLTSRLPMLRRPHRDGGPGAVRVEVRGRRNGAIESVVLAVAAFPSESAAAVAVEAGLCCLAGAGPNGAHGLAQWSKPGVMLSDLRRRGVAIFTFRDDSSDLRAG